MLPVNVMFVVWTLYYLLLSHRRVIRHEKPYTVHVIVYYFLQSDISHFLSSWVLYDCLS